MAASSISGKSTQARRGVRIRRRKPSSTNNNSSRPGDGHDLPEHRTAGPDAEGLRRIRTAYFSPAVAAKNKTVRPESRPQKTTSSVSTAKSPSIRGSRASKKAKARSVSSQNRAVRSGDATPPSDFVYGPTQPDSALTKSSDRLQPSTRPRLSTISEADITPDDSISVGAGRRASRASLLRSSTSLRRTTNTTSRLRSVLETPSSSVKKESSMFESLFGRSRHASQTHLHLVECLACGSDDIRRLESAKLACGHRMCNECLKRIFTMSVKDPAHMPPRCCTDDHIPLKHVDKLFNLKFKTLWNRKYEEYHTRNRVYCPSSKCGEWIKPSHIHKTLTGQKVAQCPRCKNKVCPTCSNLLHRTRECPLDPDIMKLVEQAKEQGWQRCYKCHAMVELKEGCNHMTCRCMAQFCMKCGAKWKTCECPWFNYTHLPGPDRLNEMGVPIEIQVLYRRVFAAGLLGRQEGDAGAPRRNRTYQDEMVQRRRQESLDEDLAQRLQLATLVEGDEPDVWGGPRDRERRRRQRERQQQEIWGIGNAGEQFMNESHVQDRNHTITVETVADAGFGRRGERSSGRRRRARRGEQNAPDAGLANNFLGDESVVAAGRTNSN